MMTTKLVIKTQEELNQVNNEFEGEIVIEGGTLINPIVLKTHYINANLILNNNAVVEMRENSQVKEMWENSQVKLMCGNSQVKEMWGNSQVKVYSKNVKINCYGYNYIFVQKGLNNTNIVLNDSSQLIESDTFNTKPTLEHYLKNYKVGEIKENSIIMYKAVHKVEGREGEKEYVSDYDRSFKYVIGNTIEHEIDTNINESCSVGLHASDLRFALNFGRDWDDMIILEVEIPKDKIVVSKDCDGKIRTSEMTVIREVNKKEYEDFI